MTSRISGASRSLPASRRSRRRPRAGRRRRPASRRRRAAGPWPGRSRSRRRLPATERTDARLQRRVTRGGARSIGNGRRRAQAGDGLFADVKGLDGPRRAARPRGVAQDHAALLLDPRRRRRALRGHRRQVHRRRDHGRLRGADRPRGPRAGGPATRRCRCSTTSPSTRPSCAARRASTSRSGSGSTRARSSPGRSGRAPQGDYTAIGHTVGLAQRMEALAEPGKAYLTEDTAELAAGFLELEDLGEFEIKGASRPIRVFELAGVGRARSRLDLSRERGFSRFVGRGDEMATFEEALRAGRRRARAAVDRRRRRPGRRQEPALPRVRRALPRARGSRSSKRRPSRTASRSPSCRSCRCCAPTSGSATRDPERIAREKIAGRALLLDPELRRRPAAALRLPRRPRPRPARCRR